MASKRQPHAVLFSLVNYECGQCKTGVVQVLSKVSKGSVTTSVSGCLDCNYHYGIRQAQELKKYTRDDMTWA